MDDVRLFGSAGSSVANLLLFGTLVALWPRPSHCLYGSCMPASPAITAAVDLWRPFIDNPVPGPVTRKEPECPGPRGGEDAVLVDAPLPVGFDLHAYADRPLYACVLVGERGRAVDAHILRGTRQGGLDRRIVRTIRRDWRFRPDPVGSGWWQRVRLNPAPVSGAIEPL
jgi:hypothetical protein